MRKVRGASMSSDKTNANILILGNSGQGKSYLLKLLLTNLRESGMRVCALDPEMEYEDLTNNLGGCFIELALRAHAHGVQPQQDAPQHLRRIELPLTPVKRLVLRLHECIQVGEDGVVLLRGRGEQVL